MSSPTIFNPGGLLAIDPRAVGQLYSAPAAPSQERGSTAIVNVRGPLQHHPEPAFDSYDAIKERVTAALAGSARTVVLSIDSPGGVVSGCFDTVDEIRELAAKAGKPLVAFIDGQATSAAYALACACSRIVSTPSAMVGSIGVIDCVADQTAADRASGLRYVIIASGKRKGDGNPHLAISEEQIAASQATVEALAEIFAELVASARSTTSEAIRKLEAGLFHGALAQTIGLVDELATFDRLLESLAPAPNQYIEARDSLRAIVADTNHPQRLAAQRALAFL
jgi:signal peptide peptidase SppA